MFNSFLVGSLEFKNCIDFFFNRVVKIFEFGVELDSKGFNFALHISQKTIWAIFQSSSDFYPNKIKKLPCLKIANFFPVIILRHMNIDKTNIFFFFANRLYFIVSAFVDYVPFKLKVREHVD